jgi:hypothetical protein
MPDDIGKPAGNCVKRVAWYIRRIISTLGWQSGVKNGVHIQKTFESNKREI